VYWQKAAVLGGHHLRGARPIAFLLAHFLHVSYRDNLRHHKRISLVFSGISGMNEVGNIRALRARLFNKNQKKIEKKENERDKIKREKALSRQALIKTLFMCSQVAAQWGSGLVV